MSGDDGLDQDGKKLTLIKGEREDDTEQDAVEEAPTLYFGSVDEFTREFLVRVYRRRVGPKTSRRWSGEWWKYAEAILRLEALWRSWEQLRLDPATGMSVWLRDHADYHMRMLFDPDGPFARCEDENRSGDPLPYVKPPDGPGGRPLFPDVREED